MTDARGARARINGWRARLAVRLCLLFAPPFAVGAQDAADSTPFATEAFADPAARVLFESAHANWKSIEQSVLRYQAVIRQRIAAAVRAPLKDRVIYRDETAVRAFWDHEYDAVVQVLGARSQYPGRSTARSQGDLDWLDDLAFDEPFDPGGDRLFFGASEGELIPGNVIEHPLAAGADTLYRYSSGDTLTLSFADGRRLRAVRLDVLPREADIHRIAGTLWIEPESGALVRAVYRLSRQFDFFRDFRSLAEAREAGEFRYVPGVFKPWTFDLSMVAVDYSLWDFQVWLPRHMRFEGRISAGIVEFPLEMDVSYQMESVTTRADADRAENAAPPAEELEPNPEPALIERHFETRAEAMAFLAGLLSEEGGVEYESAEESDFAAERDAFILAPRERALVRTSPELPPPIWDDAAGFPSEDQIGAYFADLAALPAPDVPGVPWSLDWGWGQPGLVRYNRVEGLAAGLAFETNLAGAQTVRADAFLGVSDLAPKARVETERETLRRRLTLGVYGALVSTDPRAGHLGFGNSLNAILLGRDEGEYYRAAGADLTWRPPSVARPWFEVRTYAERQAAVATHTGFALFHVLDDGWNFRPNLAADPVDELGTEVRLSPWWGRDPHLAQVGVELYGQAARRWPTSGGNGATYGRASAVVRVAAPLSHRRWRLGVELAGGTTFGEATTQRAWFLGGPRTLRGHPPSVVGGPSFGRGRVEVARTWDVGTLSVFTDAGWASHLGGQYGQGGRDGLHPLGAGPVEASPPMTDHDGLLYGVGVGGSVLDGLMRADISYGLNGIAREFRVAFYLDSLL